MARLQNFPIWGRPLRLAYANEEGSPARGEGWPAGPDAERPATAPQQRPAPSGLPSTAGDLSEAASARRRIWGDAPEVRAEQKDAGNRGDTQTSAVRSAARGAVRLVLATGSRPAMDVLPLCTFSCWLSRAFAVCPWLTPGFSGARAAKPRGREQQAHGKCNGAF